MDLQIVSFLLLVAFSTYVSCEPKHWAVLVAGSNGYFNYRHQADICHAYQILRKNGIPDERIVVMMYDDIAHNENNPTQGVLINEPHGADVYTNVPKDYVGKNVTPEVFINVLLGNATYLRDRGSGKFLDSGPEDHVFINFADHGAPGLVAFPNGELYARQLIQTLHIMYEMKKYHKLVLYVEACESGSMFQGLLPDDINVFATTAANGEESSYACYWDDDRQTYLGDVYSVRWMEDADQEEVYYETLQNEFNIVKAETNTSHVQQFGDAEMGSHYFVGEFIGMERLGSAKSVAKSPVASKRRHFRPIVDAVPAPDVPLHVLQRRYDSAESAAAKEDLLQQLRRLKKNRALLDHIVENIVDRVSGGNPVILESSYSSPSSSINVIAEKKPIRNYACFERVVSHFSRSCAPFSFNDYALRKVQAFVNLCENGVSTESVYGAITEACGRGVGPLKGIH